MFLRCSYFLGKSEADVLIKSVLIKRKACNGALPTAQVQPFDCLIKRNTKLNMMFLLNNLAL